MKQPLIGWMRETSALMRTIAASVIVTFAMLVLQPAAMAIRTEIDEQKRQAALEANDERKLSQVVRKIERQLEQLDRKLEKGNATGVDEQALAALRQEVSGLAESVGRNFQEIEAHIRKHKLDAVIVQRHTAAVARFEQELSAMLENLETVRGATDPKEKRALVQKARKHLSAQKRERAQQPFDPNDLPFQSLKPNPENKPKLDKKAFSATGLHDNPPVRLAALGDFTFDKLPGASNPDYLGETTEVRLSDAVKAKAAELGHDPVQIFRWVRNNVEWQPTWGAMQDADLTLGAQRGNAFDIASLTIALLRAAGIPARYVHGTIEVSEGKFRNWAGGFESTSAAADYASSGGIPAAALLEGGRIAKLQMEHVWVEAAIDYHPSRGAVNRDADSWVQMDPSFKQYEYLEGLDPIAISGLDPEALAKQFLESGTVNESEGWVTGFDPTILQNAQAQAQQSMEDYIADNMTDPTVGDVIGGRKTIIAEYPNLPSSLPNRILVTGTRYAQLPQALQYRMGFAFGTDVLGEPIGLVSYPMAEINNRKITLSFRPATAADEEALSSLLPEGEITDVSQLPTGIPSYLVNVVPEVKVDGQIVSTGTPMAFGEDLPFTFFVMTLGGERKPYQYNVAAGAYLSIAAIGGSVSPFEIRALETRVEITQSIVESGGSAGLSREHLVGDVLYAGVLGYFGRYMLGTSVLEQASNARSYLAAGYGSFGYEPTVTYLFGLPHAIESGSAVMNIRLISSSGSTTGDRVKARDFFLKVGVLSSKLEHEIPEAMFVTPDRPGEAVSAVKALGIANMAGQKIYHIDATNHDDTLTVVNHDSSVTGEIAAAIRLGKEVIIHENPISVGAWRGSGYIIFDPETGAAAYKISGGKNGGNLTFEDLLPTCSGTFWETTLDNFAATNTAIPGFLLPLGVSFFTQGMVARAIGSVTLFQGILASYFWSNLGWIAAGILTVLVHFVFVVLAFQVGILIGSMISAAICRRR